MLQDWDIIQKQAKENGRVKSASIAKEKYLELTSDNQGDGKAF